MLNINDFAKVIENAPLISIDFIIENNEGKFLLGKRLNKPAKDFWFTLGGRILKNEKIESAIKRLSIKELNQEITKNMLSFHGVFEHFYKDSFVNDKISTHYIVLAYKIKLTNISGFPMNEHDHYSYFTEKEIIENNSVHKYVKDYFRQGNKKNEEY